MTTQPAPAPKKSHTVRNVLLGITLLFVLFVGGCFALLGGVANEASKAIEENANRPGGDSNPLRITEGEGFEVAGFDYSDGWEISSRYGLSEIKGLKVTNNREDRDSAIVEIKAWRGQEVVAVIDCSTELIQPGTTTTLNCMGGEKMPAKYDRLTINDTF